MQERGALAERFYELEFEIREIEAAGRLADWLPVYELLGNLKKRLTPFGKTKPAAAAGAAWVAYKLNKELLDQGVFVVRAELPATRAYAVAASKYAETSMMIAAVGAEAKERGDKDIEDSYDVAALVKEMAEIDLEAALANENTEGLLAMASQFIIPVVLAYDEAIVQAISLEPAAVAEWLLWRQEKK